MEGSVPSPLRSLLSAPETRQVPLSAEGNLKSRTNFRSQGKILSREAANPGPNRSTAEYRGQMLEPAATTQPRVRAGGAQESIFRSSPCSNKNQKNPANLPSSPRNVGEGRMLCLCSATAAG